MPKSRVHLIAAARPNFMKVAPLWHALNTAEDFEPVLVHTGQHYDRVMSADIMDDLKLPSPDHYLGVGSGTHAEQTGGVMIAYEKIALQDRPDWLVVVGDVNSTVACALVGAKLSIPVVHLEAGLRSRDRKMPEEINRLATDAISDVLWTPSADADENLETEGVPRDKITLVGNIMMDSYELVRPTIRQERQHEKLGLAAKRYGIITLHRPSNVDDDARLAAIVDSLQVAAGKLDLLFPVHPRTRQRLAASGIDAVLEKSGIRLTTPFSYAQFMSLVEEAALIITDSGGIQEETTYLGIPCLTLRESTERPITITEGTNRLVTPQSLNEEIDRALGKAGQDVRRPFNWDGRTASRCVEDLRRRAGSSA